MVEGGAAGSSDSHGFLVSCNPLQGFRHGGSLLMVLVGDIDLVGANSCVVAVLLGMRNSLAVVLGYEGRRHDEEEAIVGSTRKVRVPDEGKDDSPCELKEFERILQLTF